MLASSTEMSTIMKENLTMILDYLVIKNPWNAGMINWNEHYYERNSDYDIRLPCRREPMKADMINWNEHHYQRNFDYDIRLPCKREPMKCWHDQLEWTVLWK